jgi:26S proteasome regulatory subunit N7
MLCYAMYYHCLCCHAYTQFLSDRYFAQHSQYLVKELRILAYTQFLDAYKSVVLSSMAAVFGVTVPFMDAELSRFIAAGRLNAQIDKVRCTVVTIHYTT